MRLRPLGHCQETTRGTSPSTVACSGSLRRRTSRARLDADTDNVYQVTVEANAGGEMDMHDVTVTVTDVDDAPTTNTAPEFPATEDGARSVAENTGAGGNIGAPVAATVADIGDTLTYTLGGADAASFDIAPATGQLMTKAALDYETKGQLHGRSHGHGHRQRHGHHYGDHYGDQRGPG